MIIDHFEEILIPEGEVVISHGAEPQLIIVIDGEVGILKPDVPVADVQASKNVSDLFTDVLAPGMSYGGGALLESSPMRGNLIAIGHVKLHRISHDVILQHLHEPLKEVVRLNEIKKVLSDIFLFKNLNEERLERVVRSLEKRRYDAGTAVVQQGDEATHFFLIHRGTIQVTKDGEKVRTLGRWDYFGERGLLLKEKRSASCHAEDQCVCLILDAQVFGDIVGTFRDELEHRMHLQDLDIQMPDLRLKAIVGRGSFGIVKLVSHRNDDKRCYALKCVNKQQVVRQGQQKSMVIERSINAQCYHPCIMQSIKTFQDARDVYFLTEFLGGGDLFYAIREIGSLSKEQAQFFGASITLALEYLHARSIMYRDLKPENVLLDFEGHAKLVDFGCCKIALRTNTLVGTPEYFAPEVIIGKGYTGAIDWWALGVMFHEFIVGPLPFGRGTEDQLELFREILEAPLQFPSYVKDESSVSMITGLLERTPELRLGASIRGAKEIKEHRYFTSFDWDALAGTYFKPPWTPNLRKLQKNWEARDSEPVCVDGDCGWDAGEKGMEWAQSF